MVAFLFCVTMTVAIVLQIIWPLWPYYALGCLIGNCFFHVFAIEDEREEPRKANMNGLELIVKLRGDSRFKRLPVYALTADSEVNQDGRSKLFIGILLKPITYNNLVSAIA